jgi:hypothetical protein
MLRILLPFIFIFAPACFAHDCSFLLHDGGYRAVIGQILNLNPEILEGGREPAPAEIFVRLKRESEKYATADLPERLARALRVSQAKHYAVAALGTSELSNFYRNALRALTLRAAQLWRQQEVRGIAGRPLSPRLQNFAEHLIDTFFSPNGLHDDSLSGSEATQYFASRPWMTFNWEAALATVEEQPGKSGRELEIPRVFDWNEGHRIRIAMDRDRRPGACCLSEPGCKLCPHNRLVLRR